MKNSMRAAWAKMVVLSTVLAGAVYLTGCGGGAGGVASSPASRETGSLGVVVTFQSDSGSRADWSPANLPPEVEKVIVSVSGPGMLAAKTATLTPDHPSEVITDIPVGKREVVAWGESSSGSVLAGGFDQVTIVADQRSTATLVMTPPARVTINRITGTKTVDGVDTVVMTSVSDGEETYLLADASGIYYKGELNHESSNRALTDVLWFDRPPLLIIPFGAVPGAAFEQTSNEYGDSLLTEQDHATLTYVGVEGIVTPLGSFTARRLELSEKFYPVGGSSNQASSSSLLILWMVDNLGPAAMYEEENNTNDSRFPRLSLLLDSTLAARAARATTAALGSSTFPLQQGAEWTYVDLEKRDLGDVTTSVPAG